jgi:hypothetical protein
MQEQATSTQPAPPAPPAAVPAESRPIIVTRDNGKQVKIDFKDGNLVVTQDGNTREFPWNQVVPSGAVDMAQAFATALFFLVVGWPIARAIARWIDRKGQWSRETARLSAQIEERFETLERNLDTVAIEMERLSEAQRFTTKLLADREERVPVDRQP